MNISQDILNKWAEKCWRTNGELLTLKDYLRRANAPDAIQETAWNAQGRIGRLLNALQSAGADDPAHADLVERYGEEEAASFKRREVSLELLSSPAAQRFAKALREAANACAEMEKERGIEDGFAEVLSDHADIYETEIFGPQGLRGME